MRDPRGGGEAETRGRAAATRHPPALHLGARHLPGEAGERDTLPSGEISSLGAGCLCELDTLPSGEGFSLAVGWFCELGMLSSGEGHWGHGCGCVLAWTEVSLGL